MAVLELLGSEYQTKEGEECASEMQAIFILIYQFVLVYYSKLQEAPCLQLLLSNS